jgi:hypothetical protein
MKKILNNDFADLNRIARSLGCSVFKPFAASGEQVGDANLSVWIFAKKQRKRPFSCAVGLCHGLKKNIGALDRTVSARAVDFPPP